jgi:hypothetical protein
MSGKGHVRLEEVAITEYHWSGPFKVGTLGWDSRSGTLADRVRERALEADRQGYIEIRGPVPSCFSHPITDSLHRSDQLAAVIASLDYHVPKELARFYHPRKFGRPFKKSELKRMRARGEEIIY